MYLHLGGDIVVNIKNIISIMDMENTSVSKITREYLSNAEKNKRVINVNFEELPKSYIITKEKNEIKVYISPISSVTLLKRGNNNEYFTNNMTF